MSEVEYRDVPGFPGYRVGNDGTVWTRYMPRGGRTPDGKAIGGMRLGDKWKLLKNSPCGDGNRYRVNLCRDGKSFSIAVHHVVLLAFIGSCPSGMVARHGPKGRHCHSLDNLSWGTQKENIADKYRDGTRVFGVRHHAAKMTPDTVRAARAEHAAGASALSLSKKYGIAQTTMNHIIRRISWKEVA